jgi:hypothetical protein
MTPYEMIAVNSTMNRILETDRSGGSVRGTLQEIVSASDWFVHPHRYQLR